MVGRKDVVLRDGQEGVKTLEPSQGQHLMGGDHTICDLTPEIVGEVRSQRSWLGSFDYTTTRCRGAALGGAVGYLDKGTSASAPRR